MTKLIGLTGLAGSGKDTVREILGYDHGYIGLAFADPLRGMLASLLQSAGHNPSWMVDREMKERDIPGLGVSYRLLAQTLGTEWGRYVDPNLWLKIAQSRIAQSESFERHVISDVRFANESNWVREHGFIVRIVRPGVEPVRGHVSEDGASKLYCDYTIINDGSIEKLRTSVRRCLAQLEEMIPSKSKEVAA